MNIFGRIKHIQSFKKVHYYSVCLDDEDISLFEKFMQKHQAENFTKFYHIFKWMEVIGDKYGAKENYFRHEAEISDTRALPPRGKDRKPTYIENDENKPNPLRLYCFRANENVVFLFNGDIKTSQKAQDLKNVSRPHFILANKITKSLEDAFRKKDIIWDDDFLDIIYDEQLEITIK